MDEIKEIYKRFLRDECTKEELAVLLKFFDIEDDSQYLHQLVEDTLREVDSQNLKEQPPYYIKGVVERNLEVLRNEIKHPSQQNGKLRKLIIGLSLAASICIASWFSYLYLKGWQETDSVEHISEFGDVAPGTNRAMLSLSDGKSIELDGSQGAIQVNGNSLKYSDGSEIVSTSKVQMATVSTPRAGQYQVSLPDGTRVWLNAESSIEYPMEFLGKERLVKVSGEAYFEVTHNEDLPFVVESERQRIQVLGTSFNVQSYNDEPLSSTTLVNGEIEIQDYASGKSALLSPGQHAISKDGGLTVNDVEPYNFIAWKDNYFVFESVPLRTILKHLSRWYDVEVDYEQFPNELLSARVKRDKNLSSVLHAISKTTGINFHIKGRRVIVEN